MSVKKIVSNYKEKKAVKEKAVKEAEKIFMKLNRNLAMKDGTFPKTSQYTPKAYNKEAKRVQDQVVKTRVKQWKSNKKK